MLNSKQRAFLRSMAHHLNPVIYVGKDGISENLVAEAIDYLDIHELAKCSVQQNLNADTQEVAQELAKRTESEIVQVIGRKFVLFKRNREEPKINLPK